jgi:hypothetical protein
MKSLEARKIKSVAKRDACGGEFRVLLRAMLAEEGGRARAVSGKEQQMSKP